MCTKFEKKTRRKQVGHFAGNIVASDSAKINSRFLLIRSIAANINNCDKACFLLFVFKVKLFFFPRQFGKLNINSARFPNINSAGLICAF